MSCTPATTVADCELDKGCSGQRGRNWPLASDLIAYERVLVQAAVASLPPCLPHPAQVAPPTTSTTSTPATPRRRPWTAQA
eukprot:363481-Chlamydomonas_euryale.AAC.10